MLYYVVFYIVSFGLFVGSFSFFSIVIGFFFVCSCMVV